MITRLNGFAVLSLTAIGIGVAVVVRDLMIFGGAPVEDVALLGALTLVDFVLILFAAANRRWAQYLYAGLFGAGLKFRIEGLFDLPADDAVFSAATVVTFTLHMLAIALLILEVRAQRDASRLAAAAAR